MKVSLHWLKRYLDTELSADKIAELLTDCGLEVEAVEVFETVKGSLEGIITGKVASCERHPNADKLSLTTVDIGDGKLLKIVCGAPNVAAGQKVLVAQVGTRLYKGGESFLIREATIRGELSEGMICAEDELGLGTSHEGILVLPDTVAVGIPANRYFEVYTDTILEIGLTPNRSDAFSHIGVARDLVALLNVHQLEGNAGLKLKWPDVSKFKIDNNDFQIPVTIEDPDACPRYCGLTVSGVQAGESPAWMQNLLKAAGMRPINIIVDITNFVMLETGQPLHAFDADKIAGQQIIVKKLAKNETFTTLDGIERKLSGEDLMICSARAGMCMAGVYGGLQSGVTEHTSRIFLESAYFNPVTIRKTARYHGLSTDSSQRFERGANPAMTVYALKRAALLMKELAHAQISSGIQDVYPRLIPDCKVQILYKNVDILIGKAIPHETIKKILLNLEIKIEQETEEGLLLAVPAFKVDVTREADVIEEILRIYGYNNIELSGELRYSMVHSSGLEKEKLRDLIADQLVSLGFSEIQCNSLTKADYAALSSAISPDSYVHILNPLSRDLEVMRRSLLFGGLEAMLYNLNRKASDQRLFEFGSAYSVNASVSRDSGLGRYQEEEQLCLWLCGNKSPESWYTSSSAVDFYYLKSLINNILTRAGLHSSQLEAVPVTNDIFREGLAYFSVEGKQELLLEFGEIAPAILKAFDIRSNVFYASIRWEKLMEMISSHSITYSELPRFPWVRRDLALLLDKEVPYSSVEKIAFETEHSLLRKVSLFDIYEGENLGEGKKSYAVSFILQDDQKTLTDEEIDRVMEKLIQRFRKQLGAVIR